MLQENQEIECFICRLLAAIKYLNKECIDVLIGKKEWVNMPLLTLVYCYNNLVDIFWWYTKIKR